MKNLNNLKKCYLIAEIGVNHNNNLRLAKKMIFLAKKSGANAVKFQTFKASKLAKINTPKVPYQKKKSPKKETHFEMLKNLELSEKDHLVLKHYCKLNRIDFISTPYSLDDAKFLFKIGLKNFKSSSADIVDHQMHEFLSKKANHVIISTGMATIKEISEILEIYKKNKNKNFSLLHCVSNYPCSDNSLNLKNLIFFKKKFDCQIGFSDHSIGNTASIIALGYGAKIIEKHFTVSKSLKGPDHAASSTYGEFKELALQIRRSELMLGSHRRNIQKEEINMRQVSRKSVVYKKNLEEGHKITNEDLVLMRPGFFVLGNKIKSIIGKKLKKKVKKNSFFKFSDI